MYSIILTMPIMYMYVLTYCEYQRYMCTTHDAVNFVIKHTPY